MRGVPPKVITRFRDLVQEELRCPVDSMVERFYQGVGRRLALERERERSQVRTLGGWARERARVRRALLHAFGGLPKRRLRMKECGETKKERYTLRRLLFSPFEGHWVSANLYLPRSGAGPFPAIILPHGHTQLGKEGVKDRAVFFAVNGFAVLTFDYFGSGERRILMKDGRPLAFPGAHHNLLGMRMFAEGCNLQWFMVSETMAAVDVLQRLGEVDGSRIGITGSSGGGTESFYTCALDERIKAVAPAASVHSFRYRLYADDAEQSFFNAVREGLDYPDIAAFLVAPRPLLIIANTRDIWDIKGTRHVFEVARRFYRLHGVEERLCLRAWDRGHVYEGEQLRVALRWFRKHLGDGRRCPAVVEARMSEVPSARECLVTPSGNLCEEGYRKPIAVFRAWRKRRPRLKPALPVSIGTIRSLAGQRCNWRETDVYCVDGCMGRRIVYAPERGLLLPVEILEPAKPRGTMVLLDETTRMEGLRWQLEVVRRGYVTVCPDLRGWGETAPAESWSDWENWTQNVYAGRRLRLATLMWLVGREAPVERARDVLRLLGVMAVMDLPRPWIVWGKRSGALVALCAGIADRRVDRLILEKSSVSYREAFEDDTYLLSADDLFFGLGRWGFDLSDLFRRFSPRKITVMSEQSPSWLE